MIAAGSLEYALPRLQARLARRPAPQAWRRIEHARGTAPVVELIEGTTLEEFCTPLLAAPDLHALDRAAREAFSATVAETAAWMPPAYGAALRWCEHVPRLSALAHLARGGQAPAWMRHDATLAAVAAAPVESRRHALGNGALAALAPAWERPAELPRAWAEAWIAALPLSARREESLRALAQLVPAYLAALAVAAPHESEPLRTGLEQRVLRHLRRHPLEPAAGFAWVALAWLDISRLRGELARRVGLPLARPVP